MPYSCPVLDANDFYGGILTIGQVVTGFEDILEQPRLDVVNSIATELHFQVLLDKDGLIGTDGRPIPVNSEVASNASDKRITAVIDTGFTLPQVPSSVAEAIYGRFHGAQLVTTESVGKIWLLPCLQEVNITFQFGGKLFPIHPLDATLDPTVIGLSEITDSKGNPLCIGTFQPFSYDTGAKPSYDMILGMAFLRNVYVLMDYGDFINDSNDTDVPYVQFLSTTNATQAHKEFVEMRLNGMDTTAKHLPILRAMRPIAYYIGISLTLILTSVMLALFYISRRGLKHPTSVSRQNNLEPRSKY
ncbi:hypothetical protein H0H93_010747 [Arthromyces matolae]|nr:hypothetical protein H0H93_010747 [Arthromyces matolae]